MKILSNAIKTSFIVLVLVIAFSGCRESAPLEIDPIVKDTLFTFTPSHGYPGTAVLLTGSVVNDVIEVAIGSKIAEIQSSGSGTMTVLVPVGSATGKIKLVKANAVVSSLNNFVVDDSPVPTIMSFDPPIAGWGDTVTITGSLLDIVDSVYIGDVMANILDGGTSSTLQIELNPFATDLIRMYYNYMTPYGVEKVGESQSETELTLALPVISSIEPSIGSLDIGDTLTITGSMLDEVTSVKFGDINAPLFEAVSSTEMTVVVPTGSTTGKIILIVPDGQTETDEDFVINLPSITSFLPAKGETLDPGELRIFSLQGTNLSLVTSVKVGISDATIDQQTDNLLVFTVPGGASGYIKLSTDNGTVTSAIPFFLSGDYWISDWDNVYEPNRLASDVFDIVDAAGITTESGGPTGNYRKYVGNIKSSGDMLARIYWRDDNNLFSIYTSDPTGISLEFDISYTDVPATMLQPDGSMLVHMFFFTSSRNPYGYSLDVNVPFTGAGDWQHVVVNFVDLAVDANLHNGTMEPDAATGGIKPNDIRIISPTFPGAMTSAGGSTINVNFDNIKIVIL